LALALQGELMNFAEWFEGQAYRGYLPPEEREEFHRVWDAAQSNKVDDIQRLLSPTNAEILLAAGEMTAQELRTVRAVLNGLKAKI
jgi:hypothetical protein